MLSPDAARSILAFRFTQADRDRMNCLASKARNGSLSKEEDEELETYLRVGDLIAILQSKARQSLQFPKDERSLTHRQNQSGPNSTKFLPAFQRRVEQAACRCC